MKQKDTFWEMIRGLCIIAVILIHSKVGQEYAGTPLMWEYDYWIIERQLLNFAVAIFIFLSAYFINIESINNNKTAYLGKRVKKLLLPFVIWSSVYSLINIGMDYLGGGNIDWWSYGIKFVTGRTATPFYFVIVLLQLTLLTPLLIKIAKNSNWNRIALSVTPIYLTILYYYEYSTKTQMPNYEILFPAWFVFYYLGILSKVRGIQYIRAVSKVGYARVFLLLTILLSIEEAYFMLQRGLTSGTATSQIKISSFLFSYAVINCLFAERPLLPQSGVAKILVKIGEYSYGIFFIHCIFRKPMAILLGHISVIDNILPLYHILQAGGMLVLSLLCIKIGISILGKQRASILLGF